jgi:hypothetical protein
MSVCPYGHVDIWPYGHMDIWTFRHMDVIERRTIVVVIVGEFFSHTVCFVGFIPLVVLRYVTLYLL